MSPDTRHSKVIDPNDVHIEASWPVSHLSGESQPLPDNNIVIATSERRIDHSSPTPITVYPTPPGASE